MRADTVDCGVVADAMARIVDGSDRADRALVCHVERCLRCQAELARYRRMLRLLHQLRDQRPPVGPGALQQALAGIEARAGTRVVQLALERRSGAQVWLVAAGVAATALAAVAVGAALAGDGRTATDGAMDRRPALRSVAEALVGH